MNKSINIHKTLAPKTLKTLKNLLTIFLLMTIVGCSSFIEEQSLMIESNQDPESSNLQTKSENVAKIKPLAGGMAKKASSLGKGLKSKAGELIKKGVGFVKKNAGKIATAVGAGGVGAAIGAATANKPETKPETKITQDKPIGGGNAGGSTDSGGTQGKGGAPAPTPTQTTPAPKKKMSSIEKKNRDRKSVV